MKSLMRIREQPVFIALAAVGGLLVAIIVVGLVGLLLNHRIESVTEDALRYDVELEDHGDDLRVAVLDVRHYHRNLYFEAQSDPETLSRGGIEDFEGAYALLLQEIDELEELGVRAPGAPQPDELRRMAREYYGGFRPAIDLYETDRGAFDLAVDEGLADIARLERAAQEIDQLGEELSAQSLNQVERVTGTSRVVLIGVIAGLALTGGMLAYATLRVVNELRRAYTRQQEAAEELSRVSAAKTDFLADVSHELRTPLTVVRGNAEVGLSLDGSPDHKEILEDIVGESGRMTRMVEDLLFLARSDSASLPLNMEPIAVESFLTELAERAKVLARDRGANLETELSGEGEIEIDRGQVEQAVLILVDNAAKYGPPGGTLAFSSEARSGKLRVTVADQGPGIPQEELSRIFERFYRLDKTRSRRLGGSGLGLPIAKTIVEAHEGRIEAESRVGEGTRMSIYLPLASAKADRRNERSLSKTSIHR